MRTTMNSPQSNSSESLNSAFGKLHQDVQRWIYDQQWTELREVQAKAINAILGTSNDIVLAAATASGKTEAAFLPILSQIAAGPEQSFQAVYIGPLRALINDQFFRLELLCERLKIPVFKWHGDVQDSMKRHARDKPSGVLLITPESLEALFVRRPELLSRMFGSTKFVVIDELHTFLSTERGVQLASLLKRFESKLSLKPRRVGLSATIGDLGLAASWLRPDNPSSVTIINNKSITADLRLQIRGVSTPHLTDASQGKPQPDQTEKKARTSTRADELLIRKIADHLFKTMRAKGNHLVFASSRREVEQLADILRESCESSKLSNEFFPHHGNLSREVREALEARLKEGNQHTPPP